MTKEELIRRLHECAEKDQEMGHIDADGLLLQYIDDKEIEEAYDSLPKWYA